MLEAIDAFLDRVTMYRLLLYYLAGLLVAAVGLTIFGDLHYNPAAIVFSALYLLLVCWMSNALFARVFAAPVNQESSLITALILALIISPVSSPAGILFLTAAGGLAMASKYMLAINKTHLFNPAAAAVLLTSWGAGQAASWWVGSAPLLPFVIIGGLLMLRKIRRFQMVLSFVVTALVAAIVYSVARGENPIEILQKLVFNSAMFFLAFVILTEPLTSPSTVSKQRWYGMVTGLLLPPQVHLAGLYFTPELVLIIGNLFTFFVSPRVKVFPTTMQKIEIAPNIFDFVFTPQRQFAYLPGQYMEWTLPHVSSDNRGERRYFTLASSPTESTVQLGVKFYPKGSSYKRALLALDNPESIVGAQLGGDFTLHKDKNRKLAFIAGGIGVTPYRSMIKYLIDKGERRSITMLYAATTASEVVYRDIFETARQELGIKTTYFLTKPDTPTVPPYSQPGLITSNTIRREIPDYVARTFYLSGSHEMVIAMQTALSDLGVSSYDIKTDFFPGYT